jgi:hypothetical protein
MSSSEKSQSEASSINDETVNEQADNVGVEFCYDEKEDPMFQPTDEDVERIRNELVEALNAENQMLERQKQLYEEQRDLKVAIEHAETDTKILELQKTKERLKAHLESFELRNERSLA